MLRRATTDTQKRLYQTHEHIDSEHYDNEIKITVDFERKVLS